MNYKILYNPLAGKVNDTAFHAELKAFAGDGTAEFYDICKINYKQFFGELTESDRVIIAGGDGTLNRFINDTQGLDVSGVYYFAAGSGNDFWTDIGRKKGDDPVPLGEYIAHLPTVTVAGAARKFINGVGFGIDGYCCAEGDRLKAAGKEKINYASIAIKGMLFHYKPVNAEVTVDGVTSSFKHVWIAPTMNGRYYGGGMIPTPEQDRLDGGHKISVCVMHGAGKLRTLMLFPSIFKGKHVENKKRVQVIKGERVTVKFDRPCALQIDGETVLNVTEYSCCAADIEPLLS